jgi:hypothetical protein
MALEGRGGRQGRVSGGDERRQCQEDTRSELEVGRAFEGRGYLQEGIGRELDVGMVFGGPGGRQGVSESGDGAGRTRRASGAS